MEFINYEADGAVAVLTINRPKALNALNSAVLDEINEALDAIDFDAVRALIITGAGEKSFVAGADIGEMSTQRQRARLSAKKETMFFLN